MPHLETTDLPLGQTLYEPNQPLNYAYFPLNAVISLVNILEGGQMVDATMIGNEGMVGVPLVLGTMQIPMSAVTQIAGQALRIEASIFRSTLQGNGALYSLMLRYVQVLMGQIAQNLACIRLHSAQERCCYLLAMMQDRVGSPELIITQEALSRVVGVRRAGVNEIVNTLGRAGLIGHQRGKITILDRAGLEAAGCQCYRTLRAEYGRLSRP
ncbi:Crp/Fnr family transcriptional regulator [Myxacorys almedinensis]|uniref:Crp/Fnr family transcriptional regulator n=1 Tax=Myxacorys almedinensis TaxID=2651157 RepID=UPI001EE493ED|nr:Crp/Fnr family transcriptional regulator [Myxacorys almedinensis]